MKETNTRIYKEHPLKFGMTKNRVPWWRDARTVRLKRTERRLSRSLTKIIPISPKKEKKLTDSLGRREGGSNEK